MPFALSRSHVLRRKESSSRVAWGRRDVVSEGWSGQRIRTFSVASPAPRSTVSSTEARPVLSPGALRDCKGEERAAGRRKRPRIIPKRQCRTREQLGWMVPGRSRFNPTCHAFSHDAFTIFYPLSARWTRIHSPACPTKHAATHALSPSRVARQTTHRGIESTTSTLSRSAVELQNKLNRNGVSSSCRSIR